MSKAFGEAHCSVLRINTGRGGDERGAPPDAFKRLQRPGLPGGVAGEYLRCGRGSCCCQLYPHVVTGIQELDLNNPTRPSTGEPETVPVAPPTGFGAALSAADLHAVSAFLHRFSTLTLLPRIEERANRLNAGITAARRGLKNRFTRLWKVAADDTIVDK